MGEVEAEVRRGLLWLVVIAVLAVAAWGGYRYYEAYIKVVPEELLNEALQKTLATQSYRYRVEAQLTVDGNPRQLSRLEGERDAAGNFHLRGQMTGQEVEIYQVEDTTHMLDPVSKKWMVIPGNEVRQQQLFLVEIDPIANLHFTSLQSFTYLGREKTEEGQYYRFTVQPVPESEFLKLWFKDFRYELWVGRRDHRIHRATIQAASKTSSQAAVNFSVELYDFNARVEIAPPETK